MHELKPSLAVSHKADIADGVERNGYATFDGNDFSMDIETRQAIEGLVDSFDNLPVDPYDPEGVRFRRFGQYDYLPWADALIEKPVVHDLSGNPVFEYFQPLSHNSVDGGKRRPFTPLHPNVRSSRGLRELIRFDFWSLPERKEWEGLSLTVGVHQIALRPEWGRSAVSSPNHLHRDGEPSTYIHLLKRENVSGGKNYVASPESAGIHPSYVEPGAILAQFTLENLLDSFVVDDRKVSHHVDEVHKARKEQEAVRGVFLIDFTPNMPQFV